MTEKIKRLLFTFLISHKFVFRGQVYRSNAVVNDTQVSEYEFINLGSNEVEINGVVLTGLGTGGNRVKMSCYTNEQDVTIYRLQFKKQEVQNAFANIALPFKHMLA